MHEEEHGGATLAEAWWDEADYGEELWLPGQSKLDDAGRSLLESIATASDEGRLEIPPMPKVAMDAVKLLRSDDCEVDDLAQCIELDPAITAHVLKNANSVRYGARVPIDTLSRAIGQIGMKTIKSILLEVALRKVTEGVGAAKYSQMEWSYSLHAASIARGLARRLGLNDEMCYLAGLLHDIGRVPVLQALQHKDALGEPEAGSTPEIIMESLHRGVGGQVATTWELPPAVTDAITTHLSGRLPEEPSQTEFPSTRVAEVAGDLCLAMGLGRFRTPFDVFGTGPVREIGISRDELIDFVENDVPGILEQVAAVL